MRRAIGGAAALVILGTAAAGAGGGCLQEPGAAELVREATGWRKTVARARAAEPRHDDSGEINGRIVSLEEQLAARGCPVVWNGTRYRARGRRVRNSSPGAAR